MASVTGGAPIELLKNTHKTLSSCRVNSQLKNLMHVPKFFCKTMASTLKRIGTHDGIFHCDEVLACFLLKRLPEYLSSEIVRTRDTNILDTCDIVVDVGGIYDPANHRYDHHQRGFEHTMKSLVPSRPWDIKLSSAGLIYHHFGERILETILGPPCDPELIKKLFAYVYENFIQEVDGIDNGVPMYDGEPKYRINTNLSARVKQLNPDWNNEKPYDSQKMFHVAMDLVGREFIDRIHYFTKSWWPARKLVKEAMLNRASVHESEEIVELPKYCPWGEHLLQLEEEMNISGLIKYVIYKNDNWRVECVSVKSHSFDKRLFLYEKWRGLRNEELDQATGLSGCVFVHSNGFIGGAKTRETALEMAIKTLQYSKQDVQG